MQSLLLRQRVTPIVPQPQKTYRMDFANCCLYPGGSRVHWPVCLSFQRFWALLNSRRNRCLLRGEPPWSLKHRTITGSTCTPILWANATSGPQLVGLRVHKKWKPTVIWRSIWGTRAQGGCDPTGCHHRLSSLPRRGGEGKGSCWKEGLDERSHNGPI